MGPLNSSLSDWARDDYNDYGDTCGDTPYKRTKFTKKNRKNPYPKKNKTLRSRIQNVVDRNIETKLSSHKSEGTIAGAIVLIHNHLILVDENLIQTSQGIQNPQVNQLANRIGDVITCKGIRLQFHLQLDPHQSQCMFRIYVIKSPKGAYPTDGTSSTLFVNLTGNNMMDYVNKRKFKIIKMKTVTITQRGFGTVGAVPLTEALSGQVLATPDDLRMTPASKIVSLNIPGSAFGRGGKITYNPEGGYFTAFQEYTVHILAYNSIIKTDVGVAATNCGGVNCYTRRMYFKDA